MYKKTLLLTFDYELFFLESGTPQNCLLIPTRDILNAIKGTGSSATFFVDVMYYIRMLHEDNGTREQAKLIREQLIDIISNGHRLELHLHPHWLDAKYVDGKWQFGSYSRYNMQGMDGQAIGALFKEGADALNSVAREFDSVYAVKAYRAGGWGILPFKPLREPMLANGIFIDSSVAPGVSIDMGFSNVDFTKAPDQSLYRFSGSPLERDDEGEFIEIPITTYRKTLRMKVVDKMTKGSGSGIYGDGRGIPQNRSLADRMRAMRDMVTLEGATQEQLLRNICASGKDVVNVISHPKGMTRENVSLLSRLSRNDSYELKSLYSFYEGVKDEI